MEVLTSEGGQENVAMFDAKSFALNSFKAC